MGDPWKISDMTNAELLTFCKALRGKAREYVTSLDRSSLGVFAADDELFYLAVLVVKMADARRYASADVYTELSNISSTVADDMLAVVGNEWLQATVDQVEQAVGEVMYWGFDHSQENSDNMEWRDKLIVVGSHPIAYHDYFVQDIWDIKAIKDFVSNDIDAMMATRVLSSHE